MAAANKNARLDEAGASMETENDENTGVIRFEVAIDDITPNGTSIASPTIEVLGVPWDLYVTKKPDHLRVSLFNRYSDSDDIWSVDVAAEFSLIDADGKQVIPLKFNKTFCHEAACWGRSILWEDLINEEKGFVKNGKVTIEVRFTLSGIVGIRTNPVIDFSDSSDPCHDVALVINGEKIHVNKGILAVHSPVLKAMFFGDFVEKNKKEIELNDIDHKEFIDMLKLIYPSYNKVTDGNAASLLKLADRFQVKTVFDQVEKFLLRSSQLDIISKFDLSDRYRLVKLQDQCLNLFKTVGDITKLKTTAGYKSLSDHARATLLEKVIKLDTAGGQAN